MTEQETAYPGNDLLDAIIGAEWMMFQAINERRNVRAACQDDHRTFEGMRRSQFEAWSDEAAASYLNDLVDAQKAGRNLVAEKYIYMMAMDSPNDAEIIAKTVPAPSRRGLVLAETILEIMLRQTVIFRENHPHLGRRGRPLSPDAGAEGTVSIRTYQLGELLTCSDATLEKLLSHIRQLKEKGVSFVESILFNEMRFFGYQSLAEAEQAASGHAKRKV